MGRIVNVAAASVLVIFAFKIKTVPNRTITEISTADDEFKILTSRLTVIMIVLTRLLILISSTVTGSLKILILSKSPAR
uniref:Uncharacterized protein n=1 Tax=Romanomermis culicivorax TaxID=13658 RepID=A0A915JVT5_ROMCU